MRISGNGAVSGLVVTRLQPGIYLPDGRFVRRRFCIIAEMFRDPTAFGGLIQR